MKLMFRTRGEAPDVSACAGNLIKSKENLLAQLKYEFNKRARALINKFYFRSLINV